MISAISAANSGLQTAMARFVRAARAISSATALDGSAPAVDQTDLAGSMVEMMTARLAFSASLQVMRVSHDMVAEAIGLGGYETAADRAR
ncbi:MAG: hypothetical protein ABJF01_13635 [bacterium]